MTEVLGFGLLVAVVIGLAVVGGWLLRRSGRNDGAAHGDSPSGYGGASHFGD